MLVPGKGDVKTVLQEQRFELLSQVDFRAVTPAGRIQRVVEERDLPVGTRGTQFFVEPLELLTRHVVAVEREQADTGTAKLVLLERVEALAVHVETLVVNLIRVVVIAQGRVEG